MRSRARGQGYCMGMNKKPALLHIAEQVGLANLAKEETSSLKHPEQKATLNIFHTLSTVVIFYLC